MFDYAKRQRRLGERIEAEGVDVLSPLPRPTSRRPTRAVGVTGAFFVPGKELVFVVPRMFAAFDSGRRNPNGYPAAVVANS